MDDVDSLLSSSFQVCSETFFAQDVADVHSHVSAEHDISVLQYLQLFFRPSRWFEACLFRCQEEECQKKGHVGGYYTTNQDAFR